MRRKLVLIVEDDEKVTQLLKAYLEKDGYDISTAVDGKTAIGMAEKMGPDLILLDLNLPELSGLDVCKAIRTHSKVPIIMLTARDEDTDKIVGLELGADDYITKPFSPREVVARVRAVLRRSTDLEVPPERIIIGELVIDSIRHEASYHKKPVPLTPTEFKILSVLAGNPGRVYTRLQLLDMAYGQTWEGYERNIDTHIKNIRQKLAATVSEAKIPITTVHGVGYKYEP